MKQIGKWIAKIINEFAQTDLPEDKKMRSKTVAQFKKGLKENELVKKVGEEVREFVTKFPVPGID